MDQFPISGLMPKEWSGVSKYLSKYPQQDGRGTIVAIFDTGCDVGAKGLLQTSTGQVKFIDAIDTTGSGDVDVSLCVKPNEQNEIIGLTGRVLKLNPNWINPDGKYYIGIKSLYEVAPNSVKKVITEDRSARRNNVIEAHIRDLHEQIKQLKNNIDTNNDTNDTTTSSPSLHTELLQETENRLKLVQQHYENVSKDSRGPIYDCIVWYDGENYCASIDTLELGDFTHPQIKVLYDYGLKQQYDTFNYESQFTYSIKIYPSSTIPSKQQKHMVLSIVVAGGTHGSHVAGIVGAYFGPNDERNGNAPGCQLISVKIGDSFLTTMETQAGIIRGLVESVYSKCDLINMSYGEATRVPNIGRIQTYVNEVVLKYGILFVSSAGNEGPTLTTLGAPGGTSQYSISVAAAISPDMMSAQYSIEQKGLTTPKNYQWSSRGPTFDGAMVSITGLGAAYTSVPRYTTTLLQQMNGTSMSSPSVCGILALCVSYLKHNQCTYTVHRIRHAMEQSAMFLQDNSIFAQGNGLIQLDRMIEYLDEIKDDPAFDYDYTIACNDTGAGSTVKNNQRGIYIRSPHAHLSSTRYFVGITPKFPKYQYEIQFDTSVDAVITNTDQIDLLEETNRVKAPKPTTGPLQYMPQVSKPDMYNFCRCLNFQFKDANGQIHQTLPWIEIASSTVITNTTKNIPVMIHPQGLQPGPHFAWIQAIVPSNDPIILEKYPTSIGKILFQIPVTVIIPERPIPQLTNNTTTTTISSPLNNNNYSFESTLTPLNCPTYFISTPIGASYATVTITALEPTETARGLWLSTNTLSQFKDDQRGFEIVRVSSQSSPTTVAFTVTPYRLMEFALMYPWTCQSTSLRIKMDISFHGVSIQNHGSSSPSNTLVIPTSNTIVPLNFTSISNLQHFKPTVILKRAKMFIQPTKCEIFQLASQKVLPYIGAYSREILQHEKSMYGAIITYPFTISGTKPLEGSFFFDQTCDWLYESSFSGQIVYIYKDTTNELFHVNDCFPQRRYKSYQPGSYTAYVFLKHTDPNVLEQMKQAIGSFRVKSLEKTITTPIYTSLDKGSKLTATSINPEHILGGYLHPNELYKTIFSKDELHQFDEFTGILTPFDDDYEIHGLAAKKIGISVSYHPVKNMKKVTTVDHKDVDGIVPFAMVDVLKTQAPKCKVLDYVVKDKKCDNKQGEDKKDKHDSSNDEKNDKNDDKDDNNSSTDSTPTDTTPTDTTTSTTTTSPTQSILNNLHLNPIHIINTTVPSLTLTTAPIEQTDYDTFMHDTYVETLKSIPNKKPNDDIIIQLYNTYALPFLQSAHYKLVSGTNKTTTPNTTLKPIVEKFVSILNIVINILHTISAKNIDFITTQFLLLRQLFDQTQILTQSGLYNQFQLISQQQSSTIFSNSKCNKNNKDNNNASTKQLLHDELVSLLQSFASLHIMFIYKHAMNFITTFNQIKQDELITTSDSYQTTFELFTTFQQHFNHYGVDMLTALQEKHAHKYALTLSTIYSNIISFFYTFFQSLPTSTTSTPIVIGYASIIKVIHGHKITKDVNNPITLTQYNTIMSEFFKSLVSIATKYGLGDTNGPQQIQINRVNGVIYNDTKIDESFTELLVALMNWNDVELLSNNSNVDLALNRVRRFF